MPARSGRDETIKISPEAMAFVVDEAGRRGMFKRALLTAMVQLWKVTPEARRQAAIRLAEFRRSGDSD